MMLENGRSDLDGLRLIGLGRVATCSTCPRYAGLVERYMDPRARGSKLADVPRYCKHPYCAPIAARYRDIPGLLRQRASSGC